MPSRNFFFITGNVSQPPRQFGAKTILPVATDESWIDKSSGERKTRTEYLTLTTFSEKTGAWLMANARVGQAVTADGKITAGSYEKGGEKVWTTDLVIRTVDVHPSNAKVASHDESA